MGRKIVRVAVVLVVATVLVQGVGAGVVASQTQAGASTAPADDVYVQENGDAVLVYESQPGASDVNNTEFGVNTAENLAYFRMTDPVETTPDVRGAFELLATRTDLTTQGNLSMPNPQALESFSLNATGETGEEESDSDLTVSATVRDQQGTTRMLESASTAGSITMAADRLTASGNFSATTARSLPANTRQSLDVSFSEQANGYVLTVDRNSTVNPMVGTAPQNRSAAKAALEQQSATVAMLLGGSATVELQEFSRIESSQTLRVHQAYTVRLEGVDQGLERLLGQQLAQNPQVSSEQADRLATAVGDVQIDTVGAEYRVDANGVTGSFEVDVGNYSELAMAYLDLAASMEAGSGFGTDLERLQTTLEAQRAADLEQQFTWSGSLSHPDSQSIHGEFEAQGSSSNWSAYVDELESRDTSIVRSNYDLTGAIEGDRLQVNGTASMSGEQLYQRLFGSMPNGSEMQPDTAAMVTAIRDSQPEKARLVTSYDADGLLVETGASFGNLTAIRDAVSQQANVPPVSEVAGHTGADGGETHVRVTGAIEGEVTESKARSMTGVGAETTVHLPGEWDREFQSMNVDRAREFLDFEAGTSSSGPGFGPIVAVVAVLGAALVLARRD